MIMNNMNNMNNINKILINLKILLDIIKHNNIIKNI